ncbi:HD domain-containing protein [Bacillus cereus]|uniref:HD domain-containing protein n=1 Tax=Bacillus cereus TaxID=1396 RepID=UPI000BFE00C6|nr:HD domain-containing protein [Bacillus cereus]PGR83452.1 hypothetical protein COC63_05570 [Bacillus cereus]
MGLDEVTALSNVQITEDDLYPITKENVEYFINELGYKGLETYEEMVQKIEKTGLGIENFYMTNKVLSVFIYYKYPVCIDLIFMLGNFPNPIGEDYTLGEYIRKASKYIMDDYNNKDFFGTLQRSHKNCIFMLMNKMYWEVDEKDRFKLFLDNYTNYDYGHGVLSKELVQDAFRCRTPEQCKEMREELEKVIGKTMVVTVYRGQSDKSTHYTESISWTLSKEVAKRFAKGRGYDGEIYMGAVLVEDIMSYYNGRNEQEVLVLPSAVKDVKSMNQISITDDIEILKKERYMDEYSYYRGTYIIKEYFHNFEGIHGNTHCSRVLLHSLSMARELQLPDEERHVLALASCLHDIGRVDDEEDEMHGVQSTEDIIDRGIDLFGINCVNSDDAYELEYLQEDAEDALYFLIENHCISDEKAKEKLEESHWDKEKKAYVWRLFEIFKDADGLDRVRLGDLDSNYLRTEAGKRRIFIAYSYLKVVKK